MAVVPVASVASFPSAQPTDDRVVQLLSRNTCCGLSNTSKRMIFLLNEVSGLTTVQKTTLVDRYIGVTEALRYRTRMYSFLFHTGRSVVTVGSLIVPALLSIQNSGSETVSNQIYWLTWFVSLFVTTWNGILTLFKIDKKYYFLHTTMEQLSSEAHQYLYLSGKYSGHYTKGLTPNHSNQYVFFVHNLEKIKLKQVEEEYFKLIETNSDKHHGSQPPTNEIDAKSIAGLYSPTPQQNELVSHRDALLARAISGRHVEGANENKEKEPSSSENLQTLL
jgi:hypothetical protein